MLTGDKQYKEGLRKTLAIEKRNLKIDKIIVSISAVEAFIGLSTTIVPGGKIAYNAGKISAQLINKQYKEAAITAGVAAIGNQPLSLTVTAIKFGITVRNNDKTQKSVHNLEALLK